VTPDAATGARLVSLAGWLDETMRDHRKVALAEPILGLMLAAVWAVPCESGAPVAGMTTDIERFAPVIDRLHARPGDAFGLNEAATLSNLSPAYFSRCFARVFGCGFADYAVFYRLHLAAQQVSTTSIPLSTIAYNLGFSSPSHFSARYRDRFGMSPRDYRAAARAASLQ
jgi:AraC-like DNA-binding protein